MDAFAVDAIFLIGHLYGGLEGIGTVPGRALAVWRVRDPHWSLWWMVELKIVVGAMADDCDGLFG